MKDSFGRTLDYLRVSITDRCNLRCVYCMPEAGVRSLDHGQVLTYEELLRILAVMAELGVTTVKISGGEPLVRLDAAEFLLRAKRVQGIRQVNLTTNGTLLQSLLPRLLEAGVDGINVSLDTLRPDRYAALTRRDELAAALAGIDAAYAAGVRPLKINTVLLRGQNDDEIVPLAGLARSRDLSVRFIELMPMGPGRDFAPVPGTQVLETLTAAYGAPERWEDRLGNGPAVYYSFPGFSGKIGFIDPLSHCFCGSCSRLRLTSDGYLRLCLQSGAGCDLLSALRAGCTDAELRQLITETVRRKPAGHMFDSAGAAAHTPTAMHEIGG